MANTAGAYVRLLRLEDQLQSHPFYVKASEGAVQCYMQLAKASGTPQVDIMANTAAQVARSKVTPHRRPVGTL